jgi:hypothetical protein
VNSPSNPAARGEVITLFGTGFEKWPAARRGWGSVRCGARVEQIRVLIEPAFDTG